MPINVDTQRDGPDYVLDIDFLNLRIMTMVEILKWLSYGLVYVNVIRKSDNSANNSSHGIPTKYPLGPCTHPTTPGILSQLWRDIYIRLSLITMFDFL